MTECIPYSHGIKSPKNIRLEKAAIRVGDDVFTDWRHATIRAHLIFIDIMSKDHNISPDREGFIDEEGYFYRRASCAAIAFMNGQIKEPVHTLTSEDLWDDEGNPHCKQ